MARVFDRYKSRMRQGIFYLDCLREWRYAVLRPMDYRHFFHTSQ
jgi:hypothetical protein